MDVTPRISYICLNFVNIVLHGLGFSLLLHLYKRGQRSSQRIYLLNLSLAELLQNFLRLLIHSIVLQRTFHAHHTIGKIGHCILNVANTGVYYLVFMSVFLLTGDRLLCVGMRYTKVWSQEKCLNIIKCTWICNLVISLAMFLYTYFHREGTDFARKVDIILTIYVPTTLFITFLVFAVVTYTIMFCQFLSSSRVTQRSRMTSHSSVVYTFRQSKFFMSLIIISAFLVLMVIPGLVATFTLIGGNLLSQWFEIYLNVSVTLNDTADGLIYVFLQPDVKRLLVKEVASICRRHKKDQYVVNSRTTFEISGTPHTSNMISGVLLPQHINEYGSIAIMKLNIPSTHQHPQTRFGNPETHTENRFGVRDTQETLSSEMSKFYQYGGEVQTFNYPRTDTPFLESPPEHRMVVSSMSLRLPPYPLLSTFRDLPPTPPDSDDEETPVS